MTGWRLIYSTWPDPESAEAAAREMVESGLAACANILPGMVSVYVWDGETQRASETVMLLKTGAERASELTAALSARHPYDTPAILALDIDAARSFQPFLDWITGCVSAAAR